MRTTAKQSNPVIKHQTPTNFKASYVGVSVMRDAFENIEVVKGHALVPVILRALRSTRGTWRSSGWKVVNRRGRNVKRRR